MSASGAGAARHLVALLGATASGKTAAAIAIRRRFPVEVVAADSRQARRGMRIGTAAPTDAELAAVPHHLVGIVDPDAPFTVADWLAAARAALEDIWARGALPLLVAGTGQYAWALLEGWRVPLVLVNVSRGLSSPITLGPDHNDVLAARDAGFVQLHCESCQEVLDTILMAHRIAEDERVSAPVLVNFDGFFLSFTREPVEIPDAEAARAFLPQFQPRYPTFRASRPRAPIPRHAERMSAGTAKGS